LVRNVIPIILLLSECCITILENRGRHAFEQLGRPDAERPCSFGPLDREFPFRKEAYVFANGYSWSSPPRGQGSLALIVPLDGLLRFEAGERPAELGAGEILVVGNPNIAVRAEKGDAEVRTLVISFLPARFSTLAKRT
jgi:hypothetical protein